MGYVSSILITNPPKFDNKPPVTLPLGFSRIPLVWFHDGYTVPDSL